MMMHVPPENFSADDRELRLCALDAAVRCRGEREETGDVLAHAQLVYDFLAGGRVTIHRGDNGSFVRIEQPPSRRMN
jgi:hypothetical protein